MHWGIDGQDMLSTQWSGAIQPNRKNQLDFFGPKSVLTVQGMGHKQRIFNKKESRYRSEGKTVANTAFVGTCVGWYTCVRLHHCGSQHLPRKPDVLHHTLRGG